jgi:hypothetical protein
MRDNMANMQSKGIILIDCSLFVFSQWNQEPGTRGVGSNLLQSFYHRTAQTNSHKANVSERGIKNI